MRNMSILLFLLLALLVGGVFLQIFLSKKQSKWFGLILPMITFMYPLLMIFNVAAFDGMGGHEIFIVLVSTFLAGNIPTIVLLGIYFGCREKIKMQSQLDKMNIQDL